MSDEVESGLCFSEYDRAAPECSVCLGRRQCKAEQARIAKSGGPAISTKDIRKDTVVAHDPLDVFLNKITDRLGEPETMSKKTKSGNILTIYIFLVDNEEVLRVSQSSDSKETRIKVAGRGHTDIGEEATADDYLAEAEIVLSSILG
jgi:hypothetical protein